MADLDAVGFGKHDRFGDLFTICLVPSIVFELNMQVKTALGRIRLGALGVGAGQRSLDLIRAPTNVLFPPRQVSLSGQLLKVLIVIVVLFYLKDRLEQLVSLFSDLVNLRHHLLIARV